MLKLKNIYECNLCLGSRTLHPEISIINLSDSCMQQTSIKFGVYAIILAEKCEKNHCYCGKGSCDYSYATMIFLPPEQTFRMDKEHSLPSKGYLLVFQPDQFDTSLSKRIKKYSFFDYAKSEALHLSQRETEQIVCCLRNLENELRYPADVHSSVILSYHIELMLEYCTRYYERQFITRDNQNKAIVCKTERWIDRYTEGCHPDKIQVPPPTTCAATLKLSAAYFNDLLKFETGKNWNEYFQLYLHEKEQTNAIHHAVGLI